MRPKRTDSLNSPFGGTRNSFDAFGVKLLYNENNQMRLVIRQCYLSLIRSNQKWIMEMRKFEKSLGILTLAHKVIQWKKTNIFSFSGIWWFIGLEWTENRKYFNDFPQRYQRARCVMPPTSDWILSQIQLKCYRFIENAVVFVCDALHQMRKLCSFFFSENANFSAPRTLGHVFRFE